MASQGHKHAKATLYYNRTNMFFTKEAPIMQLKDYIILFVTKVLFFRRFNETVEEEGTMTADEVVPDTRNLNTNETGRDPLSCKRSMTTFAVLVDKAEDIECLIW